jgi:uncharacterized membrane-anchored protein
VDLQTPKTRKRRMKTQSQLLQAAQAEGLLPPSSIEVLEEPSPSWVITALSLVGAQFAVWPFVVFLFLLMGNNVLGQPPVAFSVGALLVVAAVMGLRSKLPMFMTHLCFTLMFTGIALLVYSLENALDFTLVLLVLLVLQLGIAMLVRVPWVQRLMGLGAATTFMMIAPGLYLEGNMAVAYSLPLRPNAVLLALLWAAWCLFEARLSQSKLARNTAGFADGVGVALLVAVVFGSGVAFMYSGARMGSADSDTAGQATLFAFNWLVALQVLLTIAAWGWLTQHWALTAADKRREWAVLTVVYLCLAVFSFFTADGGVVALVGTAAVATGRKRMVVLTLLVLLAQLSGFYYALAWPLVKKAGLLVIVGAFLGVFLWALRKQFNVRTALSAGHHNPSPSTSAMRASLTLGLLAVGTAVALGAANYDVIKKEQVISSGQKIYISLAPRDPRSLMQGDYMALNFALPMGIRQELDGDDDNRNLQSATAVAELDARGVATVLRVASMPAQEPLAKAEILLPLLRKNRDWTLVTDAFYFPEGKGEPFKQAKFGEFRVLPDGRALLVGLADEQLKPLAPAKNKRTASELALDAEQERKMQEEEIDPETAKALPAAN